MKQPSGYFPKAFGPNMAQLLVQQSKQLRSFRILRRCCQFQLLLGRFHSFHGPLSRLDLLLLLPNPSSSPRRAPQLSIHPIAVKIMCLNSSVTFSSGFSMFLQLFHPPNHPPNPPPTPAPNLPQPSRRAPGPSSRARGSSPTVSPCGRAWPRGARSALPAAAGATPCGRSRTWWAGEPGGILQSPTKIGGRFFVRKISVDLRLFYSDALGPLGTSYDHLVEKQRYEFQRQRLIGGIYISCLRKMRQETHR